MTLLPCQPVTALQDRGRRNGLVPRAGAWVRSLNHSTRLVSEALAACNSTRMLPVTDRFTARPLGLHSLSHLRRERILDRLQAHPAARLRPRPLCDVGPVLVVPGSVQDRRADVGGQAYGAQDPLGIFGVAVEYQQAPRAAGHSSAVSAAWSFSASSAAFSATMQSMWRPSSERRSAHQTLRPPRQAALPPRSLTRSTPRSPVSMPAPRRA